MKTKEPTAGHTALPWRSEDGRIYGQNPDSETPDEILIADTAPNDAALTDYDDANARFIVTACNHHAELVEALEKLIFAGKHIATPATHDGLTLATAQAEARTLLARLNAKGQR